MDAYCQQFLDHASHIILGKQHQLKLALTCLLAKGHLLIEDIPGVGKTTLAHTMAQLLGLDYQRIQFTSDLLPADIIGSAIYEADSGRFLFQEGPVFSNLILADEINRATPKTQSALLEVMEERQVTVESETRRLPKPFFVIATQNPSQQIGTFPLPESQLDRFLMRLSIGYPDAAAERELLQSEDRRELIETLPVALPAEQLLKLQTQVARVHVADPLLDYIQALLKQSRESALFVQGLSPRAGIALLHTAKAWAMLDQRDAVYPEDVQAILGPVVGHRLQLTQSTQQDDAAQCLLTEVAIP